MSRVVKVFSGVLVALLVLLPALALVAGIVVVSLLVAGAAAGVGLAVVLLALGGLTLLCAALLLCGWFMHFHHATLHYQAHGCQHEVRLTIDLTGRQVYHQLGVRMRLMHQRGSSWLSAFEGAVDEFFGEVLRDYLLHEVGEQCGVDVAEAMTLADDQAFHFSL